MPRRASRVIYLDNSATSFPKPEEVYAFMDRFYRSHGVNPGRSGTDLSREAGELVDETRTLLAGLFNGRDPNRLCFSSNATDALNLVISGMLAPGDHVLTTNLEHNSVLRPLYHMQLHGGVEAEHVPCDANGFVDPDEFPRRFKKSTRLVIVTHASNVIGTVQPIKEIGAHCREANIPFAVDASQSAGVVPIDIEEQNIDIVVFTGHKSLMGPMGIGGLYVREGIEIRLSRAGGTGVRSAVRTHLPEYPYRLEYGTINLPGVAGLNAGVTWVQARGLEAIHDREMKLCTRLRDGLQDIKGVTTYCQDNLRDHIAVFLFNIIGFEAGAVAPLLEVDHDIVCRTGLLCAPHTHDHLGTTTANGAIRFSIGPFNTKEHIESAIAAVEDIASMRN
ncbi:MAG: aminotransferase class V-fold PLP-dependent enzyme [Planctomycetota bacterium]